MMQGAGSIGVFDSGYGGLSMLRELRRVLPETDFTYNINCLNVEDHP